MEIKAEEKKFSLGKYGEMNYLQWLHPWEKEKTFSEEKIDLLRKFIHEDDVVVDVGAHTGDTTLPMMVAVGPYGRVLAFEPNPICFGILEQNISLNQGKGFGRCTITKAAFSDGFGRKVFHYTDPLLCNGGYASGLAAGIGFAGNTYPLEVTTFEMGNWLRRYALEDLQRITFIKIDTEGHDGVIINAAKKLFTQIRPLIQVELYDGLTVQEMEFLWESINSIDYSVWDFPHHDVDKVLCPLSKDGLTGLEAISGHDLICLPKEKTWTEVKIRP